MAIVVIGRNGVGLGHQSRLAALCDALLDIGQTPVLLRQGKVHDVIGGSYPVLPCPYFDEMSQSERLAWLRHVEAYADLSNPAVVIEDTHPIGVQYSERVKKILIIRPLMFSAMMELLKGAKTRFDHYLVADEPSSPTWPYSSHQTRIIANIPGLSIVGPIFRSPRTNEIALVRRRYRYRPAEKICLFSMGGGGDHDGAEDAAQFVDQAITMGKALKAFDQQARLVFVKGPLFPQHMVVPPFFEVVDAERQMPALFRLAHSAMIRLGFNSVWEAISGATPIIPFAGTSFQEPMQERSAALIRNKLAFTDIVTAWQANKFTTDTTDDARKLRRRWTGKPNRKVLDLVCEALHLSDNFIVGPSTRCAFPNRFQYVDEVTDVSQHDVVIHKGQSPLVQIKATFNSARRGLRSVTSAAETATSSSYMQKELANFLLETLSYADSRRHSQSPLRRFHTLPDVVVRIDDVVELHDGIKRLVHFALEKEIPLAFEVIPFHCKVTEERLRSIGLSESNLQIGQHGYSHLPFKGFESERAEFNPYRDRPAPFELQSLRSGKVMLQQRFGTLFCGGYSAPFDRLSPWLPEAWYQLGGTFLSYIWDRPSGARIKAVKVPVDVWNWEARRMKPIGDLVVDLCRFTTRNGYTGMVLHQQHFHYAGYLEFITKLLSVMIDSGYRPVPLKLHACLQGSRTAKSVYRVYEREATPK